jgi:Asp-tRNA(Asn)/Glu-tRNA(Gln) amidotransferase A subunit family amidase
MTELADLDAVTLRQLIGAKAVSPREILASCIRRIEAVNPAVNAFVTTCFERAEAEARAAEEAVMAGRPLGPLHGLPVGVKDLEETAGVRTSHGSPLFANHVPAADERIVACVRQAGAIVVGKTNTPEFGAGANTTNAVFGPSRNPFERTRSCGGSSGGSAVALACGMVPIATGSDLAGSLRTPAAYCGVVGFRPSPGLVPAERKPMGYQPLSVLGPMGRNVPDTAFLLAGMAGYDGRDPLSKPVEPDSFARLPDCDLASLRVALTADLGFAPVDDGIRHVFRRAAEGFAGVFARADWRDPDLHESDRVLDVLRAVAFVGAHRDKLEKTPELVGPNVAANVKRGLGMSLADVAEAMVAHSALQRRFLAFMEDYDVLICPATAVPPFPVEQLYVDSINGERFDVYYRWLALAYGLTLTGHPVVCIPCGRDAVNTPFGIQVCGRWGRDREALGIAAALERHLATVPGLARPIPDLAALAA